jgi:creatinine amidohydrolase
MNTCILAESTHAYVRAHKWDVAVLPFGACEPHNYHLPYGTDIYEAETVGRLACEYAFNKGAKVLLLPAIPYGVNTNHFDIQGSVTVSLCPTTLLKILTDLVESLTRKGIRKIVLLNSHGGNELKPLVRELHHRFDAFLCVCDWYKVAKDQKIFDNPGDHADEMETSFGLLHFPHLVDLKSAGPGTPRPTRFEATEKGWIQISRPWHLLTEDTGVGDPSKASPEKAKKLLDIVTQRLGTFLYELAKSPLDDKFPFVP